MLEDFYNINEVTGVEIIVGRDGSTLINVCSIIKKQHQLSFENKITDLKSVGQLPANIKAKAILSLNLSGKGILQKQINRTEVIDQQNFGQLLPNADINDFYIQNFISGDQSFVSVVRKAEADKWLQQLIEMGYEVLMLSLGPFPVANILDQLNEYGEVVVFNGHTISRNEQAEWVAYRFSDNEKALFPLKIDTESIPENLLIAYAAAFQLMLSEKVTAIKAEVPQLAIALQDSLGNNKLKFQGFLLLIGFFVILMVNFLAFSWLNNSNSELSMQATRFSQSESDIVQLSTQIQQKEELLKELGWQQNIDQSILIDQLASLTPQEVSWKEAAVNPIDLMATRAQKTIMFFNRKIRLIGNSEKIVPVNEWIARIKTKPWVKNVQLDNYTFNPEQNTGTFIILIDY